MTFWVQLQILLIELIILFLKNTVQKTCLIFQEGEYTLTSTWKIEVSNADQLP